MDWIQTAKVLLSILSGYALAMAIINFAYRSVGHGPRRKWRRYPWRFPLRRRDARERRPFDGQGRARHFLAQLWQEAYGVPWAVRFEGRWRNPAYFERWPWTCVICRREWIPGYDTVPLFGRFGYKDENGQFHPYDKNDHGPHEGHRAYGWYQADFGLWTKTGLATDHAKNAHGWHFQELTENGLQGGNCLTGETVELRPARHATVEALDYGGRWALAHLLGVFRLFGLFGRIIKNGFFRLYGFFRWDVKNGLFGLFRLFRHFGRFLPIMAKKARGDFRTWRDLWQFADPENETYFCTAFLDTVAPDTFRVETPEGPIYGQDHFAGLETMIKTGHVDALAGTPCPPMGRYAGTTCPPMASILLEEGAQGQEPHKDTTFIGGTHHED